MRKTRRALLASLLTALVVAVGHALSGIPNVELVTVLVFISGFLLGPLLGAGVGAASATLHSMLNPLGAAPPPLLAAQIVATGTIGFAGGLLGPVLGRMNTRWVAVAYCGLTGFVLTLGFQVMVGVGSFYAFAGDKAFAALLAYIWAGLLFTVFHLIWNTGVFIAVVRPALAVLDRYRTELR